jgi:hypothetical protein
MSAETERRLLQAAIAFACAVPLAMGGLSLIEGPAVLKGVRNAPPTDLDSHFRYLSGLLLGIGIAFAACIPRIERRGAIFRTLCVIVVIGGLGRLVSLIEHGAPSAGHRFALAMELGIVPLLALWQARVARRCATSSSS